ncbi:type VI secretion system Vgr family protein [Ruegeria sp. HKCCD8929]|uniref:type VI secretion system Vgr family protein n=1 Tax=Ruegeria sp. HKCCD8929 TaxID=2683006 RepID=UPI001489D5F4|nr:type VI secretion system tip protein TssI/VgrG [Ruegeria sp. HKCCD8929]
MAADKMHEKSPIWMTGSYSVKKEDMVIRRAIVKEGMGELTEMSVEFLSQNTKLKLEDLLGQTLTVHLSTAEDNERKFTGTIISVEKLALRDGYVHLLAELRPWMWLLTRTRNSRIFQDLSAVQIIDKVLGDAGFSDYKKRLSGTYAAREYCVQYRETDFDFISRLMQEEGIYYYFNHSDSGPKNEELVISDGRGSHDKLPEESKLTFYAGDDSKQKLDDHVSEWGSGESLTSSMMSLRDFDFEKPTAETEVREKTTLKPKHKHKSLEVYDYPRHYRADTALGKKRAQVLMEAEETRFQMLRGKGTVRTLQTGGVFSLEGRDEFKGQEYLITSCTYYLQTTSGFSFVKKETDLDVGALDFPEENKDLFLAEFFVCPSKTQFRSPLTTQWPEISGLHTAIVTGKSGEEIWTDKHGRIKVQFHWDREGKKDENTTCWVRVVTPWSGKQWGMVSIPRIGQEVVIQFEEGDPDRPICTGMLYNAETMPPYELPANQTQSGIKTNSSKGGGGFNELMFEDKKDEELVRFQAQKDHERLVKDRVVETIGLDASAVKVTAGDEKSYTLNVKQNVTETIQDGDHTFTISTGSQTVAIKTDQTETIEGKSDRTVTGNNTETIKQGNQVESVDTGNKTTTVKMGNITVKASAGKITMEAMQSIELKVGPSSVKLDPSGVTIKGLQINVQGTAMAEVKSPLTTVSGDGLLTLKGGMTMIN